VLEIVRRLPVIAVRFWCGVIGLAVAWLVVEMVRGIYGHTSSVYLTVGTWMGGICWVVLTAAVWLRSPNVHKPHPLIARVGITASMLTAWIWLIVPEMREFSQGVNTMLLLAVSIFMLFLAFVPEEWLKNPA
jgi:hypothetical protein